jgi:hypothetical protein
VVQNLPAFRIDGYDHAGWVRWPDRPGVVLFDQCRWTIADAGARR